MGIEAVIAQFIPDPQQNQQARRHTDRQTQNINGRKSLVLPEIPESRFQVVTQHKFQVMDV
jgi:hypothetical protein